MDKLTPKGQLINYIDSSYDRTKDFETREYELETNDHGIHIFTWSQEMLTKYFQDTFNDQLTSTDNRPRQVYAYAFVDRQIDEQ